MMTRREAIEALKYLISGKCPDTQMDYVDEIQMAITDMKICDANNAGWISVKERLPERDGKYLVVSKTALAELPPHVKTAWFLNNLRDNSQFKYEGEPNEPGFYNGDGEGDWVERYVTHWMPLPEPPKEET